MLSTSVSLEPDIQHDEPSLTLQTEPDVQPTTTHTETNSQSESRVGVDPQTSTCQSVQIGGEYLFFKKTSTF